MGKKLTTTEFIQRAILIHGDTYDYSESVYVHGKTKLTIICPIHGAFLQIPEAHINNRSGCMDCGRSKTLNARTRTTEQFIEQSKLIHGDTYIYDNSVFEHDKKKLVITCKLHGNFLQTPHNHISSKQGCSKCKSSHGERTIRNILINHDVSFSEQYRHKTCKSDRMLPFDFYLPDYNLLIEFHGKQHFEFAPRFHRTLDGFEQQKIRDSIKKQWALDNNYNLLEISYQDINNIENILIANLGL